MTLLTSAWGDVRSLGSIAPLTPPPPVTAPLATGGSRLPRPADISKELPVAQNGPIRIVIAEDHTVVREGLAALINRRPDMTVVAQVANGLELVEAFLLHRPDVALVDLRMPEMDGADAIAAIRMQLPLARAIVLTTYDDAVDIKRSVEAGARAYVLKGSPCQELLACIKVVHGGGTVIPEGLGPKLA